MKKTQHRKHATTVLRLADLERAKSAVLNSLASTRARSSSGRSATSWESADTSSSTTLALSRSVSVNWRTGSRNTRNA
jgi:hypothetical protein